MSGTESGGDWSMWEITWINKKGKKHVSVVSTKIEAEQILDNLEAAGIDPKTFTIGIL